MPSPSRYNRRVQRRTAKERVKAYLNNVKASGCVLCGYSKCLLALDFHHINQDKERTISDIKHSMLQARREASKCIVVCSNCHREIHAGQIEQYEHVSTVQEVEEPPLLRLINAK